MIQLLLSMLIALEGPEATARLSGRQMNAIRIYAHTLAELRAGAKKASVEQVFTAALDVRELLVASEDPTTEDLSEQDYEELLPQLSGIILSHSHIILAEPDPAFFSQLAAAYGGSVDREFFAMYEATFPDGVWPVYLTEQSPYSGCTEFGEGHLVRSYEGWTRFRSAYPRRYRRKVDRIISDIEKEIVSVCACGDQESVLRELREFARLFPRSAIHGAVLDLIQDVEQGSSSARFNCRTG